MLEARRTVPRPDVNNALREETLIGEAQAAPKKKREKKKKKEEQTLFFPFGEWSHPQPS